MEQSNYIENSQGTNINFIQLETIRLILTGISHQDMKQEFDKLPKSEIKQILGHRSEDEVFEKKNKNIKTGILATIEGLYYFCSRTRSQVK